MPAKIPTPCTYPGCPRLSVSRGRCNDHKAERRKDYDRRRGSASSRGYGRRWKRLRDSVLAEHPVCQADGCDELATDVDHITPKRKGGTDSLDNLQALCHSCHSAKTARGE